MSLTKSQNRFLRGKAHHLKPVLMVGDKGVTENLLKELDITLENHELIKVTIAAERDERKLISEELCSESGAALVQSIGRISILYRPAEKPVIKLPK